MVVLKKEDRVRYVGPIDLPTEQKQGDEGTVTWAGDICIGQVTLRDCVRVKWDAVPFQSHVPAHLVEIVTASPLALNPAVVSARRRHNRPCHRPAAVFHGVSRFLAVSAYLTCIPLANWLISNLGTTCVPDGPCLVPVGFGLLAPSGVLVIGLALVLRDFVQRDLGRDWTITAILAGAALSAIVAPPALVLASTASFLLSELADMGVYTPLRERRLALAVLASGLVGAIVDSVVFLLLAFGNLAYIEGLIVGKLWASLAAFGLIIALRQRGEIDA